MSEVSPGASNIRLCAVFLLCGLLLLMGMVRAGASEPKVGLTLRPLRDRGGIERGLNRRLTDALKKFLGEHSDFLSQTEISERNIQDSPFAPSHYILTGEISFARERYFLVLRLFRGDSRRYLVGQWAGTSDSFRYLTANLRQIPHVHPYGLIGELGKRVLETLKADWNRPERRWLTLLAGMEEGEPLSLLQSGEAFRVRLPLSTTESVFLLAFDETGNPTLTTLMAQTDAESPNLSQLVTLSVKNREVWVLWLATTASGQNISSRRFFCTQDPEGLPVSVLDGVDSPPVPTLDAAQEALIAQIGLQGAKWRKAHVRTTRKSP